MKVKLLVEFEVEGLEDAELLDHQAKSAASQAAYDYLAFVKVSGYTSDAESVVVDADGYGACRVRIGEGHE